jgi:hypothetical protein
VRSSASEPAPTSSADREHALEQGRTLVDFAEHRVRRHVDVLEREPRGVAAVDHDGALAREAGRLGVDQKQRHALLIVDAACGARRDDEEIGDMAVDHEGLGAVESETVGVSGGGKRDAARLVLGAFVDRQRGDELAGGDAGQMLVLVLR